MGLLQASYVHLWRMDLFAFRLAHRLVYGSAISFWSITIANDT